MSNLGLDLFERIWPSFDKPWESNVLMDRSRSAIH